MSKTALTKQIEIALFSYTKSDCAGIYGAYEVTFGAAYGDERVDYVTLKSNGEIRCYEIKVVNRIFTVKPKCHFMVITTIMLCRKNYITKSGTKCRGLSV